MGIASSVNVRQGLDILDKVAKSTTKRWYLLDEVTCFGLPVTRDANPDDKDLTFIQDRLKTFEVKTGTIIRNVVSANGIDPDYGTLSMISWKYALSSKPPLERVRIRGIDPSNIEISLFNEPTGMCTHYDTLDYEFDHQCLAFRNWYRGTTLHRVLLVRPK